MIIKHVISLCKRDRRMTLYDDHSGASAAQWLGATDAVYPLQHMPQLDENNVFTVFDITSKQADKIIFRREELPKIVDFRDVVECENALETADIEIGFGGTLLLPLHTSQGIRFIDKAYLRPLADCDEDMLMFYERTTADGDLYIAAKVGMILAAIITPLDVVNEKFVERLRVITKDCTIALSRKKVKEGFEQ